MKKKKGVMSLWRYLILSLVGLIGIAGTTVLVLWLVGSFDPDYIEPENISFEKTLSEGKGFYNDSLGQYEIASDTFKLMITSSTENVTEGVINLSLLDGNLKDGYISDGKIKVPTQVEINKPFTVRLEPTFDEQLQKNLYFGGISTLTAKSTNVLLEPQTVKIATDCPVDSINVKISGKQQSTEIKEVSVGELFTLDTEFLPVNDERGISSQYMFSDSSRLKKIFYAQNSSAYIDYDWENEKFVANRRSGNAYDTITVYTFKNAYYQTDFMNQVGTSGKTNSELSQQEMTDAFMQYIDQFSDAYVSQLIKIKVLDVKVKSSGVTVESNGAIFSSVFDSYYVITTNSDEGDATLGLSIKDTDGNTLKELNGDVGIRLPELARKAIANRQLMIEGGKLVKVQSLNGVLTISKIDYSDSLDLESNGDGVTSARIEYYLLPNTSPKDPDNYYWRFAMSSKDNSESIDMMKIQLNFFFKNEENKLENLFKFDGIAVDDSNEMEKEIEKNFYYSVEAYNEENIGWASQNGLSLTINYDESGNAESKTYDLFQDINTINESNLYQTIRYFLLIDSSFIATGSMQDYFVCGEGKTYVNNYKGVQLSITNLPSTTGGYTLYELDSSILTAKKSFSGKAYVVFATIKTNVDNKPYIDESGLYRIVKISGVKEIYVDSSLSVANMTSSFSIADEMMTRVTTDGNKNYIPIVNKNDDGQEIGVLKFSLTIESNNLERSDKNNDIDKILSAVNTPSNTSSLRLVNVDKNGNETNDYMKLENFIYLSTEGNTATFEAIMKIDKSLLTSTTTDKLVRFQLVYSDGVKNQYKNIYLDGDADKEIYLYNQQVSAFEGVFEKDTIHSIKDDAGNYKDIEVEVTASTAGMSIKWGDDWTLVADGDKTVLDVLNEQLEFEMLDQHGKKISENDDLYYVRLEEVVPDEGKSILSFDETKTKIQNFKSTQAVEVETSLIAYVVDGVGNKVTDVTGAEIASPRLTFKVKSESIKSVWYDNNDWSEDADSKDWKESLDTSTITIERYVQGGDSIDLSDLIRVYTNDAPENAEAVDGTTSVKTEVTFDNTFLSGLGTAKDELKKMFDLTVISTETAPVDDDLQSYINKKLSKIEFKTIFNERTEIVFKVTGENSSLFNLTLKLVCLPALYIDTSAFNTYQTEREDYLATSGNSIGVFAGEKFLLNDYAKIGSFVNRITVTGNEWLAGTICYTLSNDGIAKFDTTGNVTLEILESNVYNYLPLTVTLYYGGQSGTYILNKSISLYVNPNIVVQQKLINQTSNTPYLDIENIAERNCSLSDNYKFYKMTAYLGAGKSFVGLTELNLKSIVGASMCYVNNTTQFDKYISIDSDNKVVISSASDLTMNFSLGDMYSQTFSLRDSNSNTSNTIKAVTVIEHYQTDGVTTTMVGDPVVKKCDSNDGLCLEYNIGLDIDGHGIVTDSVGEVKSITYDNEKYLLLKTNTKYDVNTNYEIVGVSGEALKQTSGKQFRTLVELKTGAGFISYSNNILKMSRIFSDATTGNSISVNFGLKTLVSALGYNFVYYNNSGTFDSENMEFNKCVTTSGESVTDDLKDLLEINDNRIAQEVRAGETYTVIHNGTATAPTELKDAIGFYYDETLLTASVKSLQSNISIVEDAEGYVSDLATIDGNKLVIKHLDEKIGEAYITLKFELYNGKEETNKFVWYYRLHVKASYQLEDVKYPFADTKEYLDVSSKYYNGEEYQVDLVEKLDLSNSKYSDEKSRFSKPVDGDGNEIASVTCEYTFENVMVESNLVDWEDYFEILTVDGDVFKAKLKDNTTVVSVEIVKTYFCSGLKMIGSERRYKFVFNQDFGYVHELYKDSVIEENKVAQTDGVYELDIKAGQELKLIPKIQIYSNGSYINETNYNIVVKSNTAEVEVKSSLKGVRYIKKGATYYEDEEKNVGYIAQEDMYSSDWLSSAGWGAELTETSLKINEKTYYGISVDDIGYSYIKPDTDGSFSIKIQDSIENDRQIELDCYTENCIVFKIILNVTSQWILVRNEDLELKGGQKYFIYNNDDANKNNSIFSEIKLKGNDPTAIRIELLNKDEKYLDVTKNDVAQFTDTGKCISFAHLPEDVTLVYKMTVERHVWPYPIGVYTFTIELNVKADIENLDEGYSVDQTSEDRYSNCEFEVEKADVKDVIPFYDKDENFVFIDDSNKIMYNEYTDTTIYPTQTIKMAYMFNSTKIFEFDVNYKYKVVPSATVDTNYPAPNGETELDSQTEYISATAVGETYRSEKLNDFFNTSAPFALSNSDGVKFKRIESTVVSASIEKHWTIAVSKISNAKVIYETGGRTGTIDSTSADKSIVTDYNDSTTLDPVVNLTFELEQVSAVADVEFAVTVNGVTALYNIQVTNSDIYSTASNKPNSDLDNVEIVYAEDLVGNSLKIFEQGRILNFKTLSSVSENLTYYVRLVKGTDIKVLELRVKKPGEIENFDLGQSYFGYKYEGTYNNSENAMQAKEMIDEKMYTIIPTLTNRITASYMGEKIALDSNIQLFVRRSTEAEDVRTNVSEFTISEEDYLKTVSISAYLKIGEKEIDLNSNYRYTIDLEFDVTGTADNINSYTAIEMTPQRKNGQLAGYSLMTGFNGLTISNKRTGKQYGQTGFIDSKGEIDLQLYGISTLQIDDSKTSKFEYSEEIKSKTTEEARLNAVASYFHYVLSTEVNEYGIKYSKGINPSYIQGINLGTNSLENYVYLAGQQNSGTNGKLYDYTITPQGASNDGNYVMMRLSYFVNADTITFVKYHNILFKILPNSVIKFKKGAESTAIVDAESEVVENQTIATNKDISYQITSDSSKDVIFWSEKPSDPIVLIANMYGDSLNSAESFSYSIELNKKIEENVYNNLKRFENSLVEEDGINSNYWKIGAGGEYEGQGNRVTGESEETWKNLKLTIPDIVFGEKMFLVEIENKFGYKVRFYITITDSTNPVISSMNETTLTEGADIVFGSTYSKVTTGAEEDKVKVSAFKYEKKGYTSEEETGTETKYVYNNEIRVYGNVNIKVRLSVYDSSSGTEYYRDLTSKERNDGYSEYEIWETDVNSEDAYWKYKDENGEEKVVIRKDSSLFQSGMSEEEIGVTQETLKDREINITLSNFESSDKFEVKYYDPKILEGENDKKILQAKTDADYKSLSIVYIAGDTQVPNFEEGRPTTADNELIMTTISGISAYGFAQGTITKNSDDVERYKSKVNAIKVRAVDFYYDGNWLGGSYLDSSGEGKMKLEESKSETDAFLISDSSLQFINEDGNPEYGYDYLTTGKFKIPYIPGIYYGYGDELENVTMKVTLCTSDAGEDFSTQVSYTVNLMRKQNLSGLFESEIVRDGNSPKVKTSGEGALTSGDKIFNDTLEVMLAPNGEVSFELIKVNETSGNSETSDKITLKNNNSYECSQFISVSSQFKDFENPSINSLIIEINVTSGTDSLKGFRYGQSILRKCLLSDYQYSFYLGNYCKEDQDHMISLGIDDVDELANGNAKQVELFFIYCKNSETDQNDYEGKLFTLNYKFSQTFSVKPLYDESHNYNNYDQVEDEFTVSEYMKATNTNGDTYYMIPLVSWAKNIKLLQDGTIVNDVGLYNDTYKFYFKIGDTGGSAYIDENGLITTLTGFDLYSHVINIDVYMKVTGYDKNFSINDESIKIGQFKINLDQKPDGTFETISTSTIMTGNMTDTSSKGFQDDVFAIGSGWMLESNITGYKFSPNSSFDSDTDEYYYDAGEIVDLQYLIKDKINEFLKEKTNTTVRLLLDNENAITSNNMNTYSFTKGNHKITIVCTGRDEYGNVWKWFYKIDVIVGDSAKTEYETSEIIVGEEVSLDSNYTWYEKQENGKLKKVVDVIFPDSGIFEKQLVAVKNDDPTIVENKNYTYFVYKNDVKEVSVALGQNDSWRIDGLNEVFDKTEEEGYSYVYEYKYYNNKFEEITSVAYTNSLNTVVEGEVYYVLITTTKTKNDTKTVTKTSELVKIDLDVKIRQKSVETIAMYLESADKDIEKVKELIKADLGTDSFTLEAMSSNNILTEANSIKIQDNDYVSYLVTYTGSNGKVKMVKYNIGVYLYESQKVVTKNGITPTALYVLSNLDTDIKTATGNSGATSISYYKLEGSTLKQYTMVSVENDYADEFYVKVDDKAYLIMLNLNVE